MSSPYGSRDPNKPLQNVPQPTQQPQQNPATQQNSPYYSNRNPDQPLQRTPVQQPEQSQQTPSQASVVVLSTIARENPDLLKKLPEGAVPVSYDREKQTVNYITAEQAKQQRASERFYTDAGYPQFGGKYNPIDVPVDKKIASIREVSTDGSKILEVTFKPSGQPAGLDLAKQQSETQSRFQLSSNVRQGTAPVGMTNSQITANLSPADKASFEQWQGEKVKASMLNLGLFLMASAVAPAIGPVAAVEAAGAGIGVSQVVKTGATVIQGGKIENSLLTLQEAVSAAETGVIFAGAGKGVMEVVGQAGKIGSQVVKAPVGRFGVNTASGIGVGETLEVAQTGKATPEGLVQNTLFSAGMAGLGEAAGAARSRLPTQIGGGVKGVSLEVTREAQLTTPIEKPLPNNSNISIEGTVPKGDVVKQTVTTRATEVSLKDVRVPLKDAQVANSLLENSKGKVLDLAGDETVTTFRPPSKETAKFRTDTLENHYPQAGEVTTYGRVDARGLPAERGMETIVDQNVRGSLVGISQADLSTAKVGRLQGDFLDAKVTVSKQGAVEQPQNFERRFTVAEGTTNVLSADPAALRSRVLGAKGGEQFSESRVAEPYLTVAQGGEIQAIKAQGNTPSEAKRVSIQTGRGNLDNAVTEMRFTSGMSVKGAEYSEFGVKLPESKAPDKPMVLLTEVKGAPKGAENKSVLAERNFTKTTLRAEVNPSDVAAYAQNLPSNIRDDIYKQVGVGEMEGAPKGVGEQFVAKGKETTFTNDINLEMLKVEAQQRPKAKPVSDEWLGNKIESDFNASQAKLKEGVTPEQYAKWTKTSGSMKPLEGFVNAENVREGNSANAKLTFEELGGETKTTKSNTVSVEVPRNLVSVDIEGSKAPLDLAAVNTVDVVQRQQKKQQQAAPIRFASDLGVSGQQSVNPFTKKQNRNFYQESSRVVDDGEDTFSGYYPDSGLNTPVRIDQPNYIMPGTSRKIGGDVSNQFDQSFKPITAFDQDRRQGQDGGGMFSSLFTAEKPRFDNLTGADLKTGLFPVTGPSTGVSPIETPINKLPTPQEPKPIDKTQNITDTFSDNSFSFKGGFNFPGGKFESFGSDFPKLGRKGSVKSYARVYPIVTGVDLVF